MASLATDLRSWLIGQVKWLATPWRLWGSIFVVVAALSICTLIPRPPEDQVRYAGLALQLLGVSTVVYLLRDKGRAFERPGFIAFLRSWFASRPKFRPATQVFSIGGTVAMSGTLRATVSTWRGSAQDASVEDRLAALESNVLTLRSQLDSTTRDARTATEQLNSEITAEREARKSSLTALDRKVSRFAADGLHIEAAGVFWLISGIVLATVPVEAVALFRLAAQ